MLHVLVLIALLLSAGCSGPSEPARQPTPTPTVVEVAPLDLSTPEPEEPDVADLIEEGVELASGKQYEQAVPVLERAEALAPDDLKVHQWLFVCYKNLEAEPGRETMAHRHARRVVELAGGSLQARQARDYLDMVAEMPEIPRQAGKIPQDVSGWEKASWGMSEAELQAAYGGKLQSLDDSDYWYYSYAHEDERLYTRRMMAGEWYEAVFGLDSQGRLSGIYMRPEHYKATTPEDFLAVEKMLILRYGPPHDASGSGTDAIRNWRFPSTTIRLNRYGGQVIAVEYKPTRR
ncbi:MAG: hypothetical protein HY319_24005 [Armatimonadetes bacterium]|nr:hypothetical protein [Armatimonadota bacterium]